MNLDVVIAEFSKFAGILSAALSQHHLSGFGITQLEFHHGLGPRDALKKDSRGLSRGVAGNPLFPRLLSGTLGNFPGCL